MTIAEVRSLCVKPFRSITRKPIMDLIEEVIKKLNYEQVVGELWLDGSFVTEKIDPDDVDVLLHVSANPYESDARFRSAVDWATDPARKDTHSFDAYKWVEYKAEHPLFRLSERDRKDWSEFFGHGRNKAAKGIITISLPVVVA